MENSGIGGREPRPLAHEPVAEDAAFAKSTGEWRFGVVVACSDQRVADPRGASFGQRLTYTDK
eukprot:15450234-Alexandrium_andersonii.AAC.1